MKSYRFSVLVAIGAFAAILFGNLAPAAAVPCATGTFSATGQAPCQLAPRGTFVPTPGQTFATQAAAGFYVDTEGSSFALQAPVGYFVPGTGSALPSPAPGGHFVNTTGQNTSTPCAPGTASRAGAATCAAVPSGVPQALGPDFDSNFGPGGTVVVGRSVPDPITDITAPISIDLVIRNDAVDHGLTGALSSDLTLLSATFRGDNAGLFTLGGFTPGMVLGEGESATFTLGVSAFDVAALGWPGFVSSELTFRTDQGNAFGFDPIGFGFDPVAVEESYALFRDPATTPSLGRPLSREFTFTVVAAVPEPAALPLMLFGLAALGAITRRRVRARADG